MDKTIEKGLNMVGTKEEEILGQGTIEEHKIVEDKCLEILIGEEVGQEIDNIQVSSTRSRSYSRAITNGDRIRCFKCREYDHFAKACPNITVTDEVQREQIQQMPDSEEPKTTLNILTGETYDSLTRANLEEMINH